MHQKVKLQKGCPSADPYGGAKKVKNKNKNKNNNNTKPKLRGREMPQKPQPFNSNASENSVNCMLQQRWQWIVQEKSKDSVNSRKHSKVGQIFMSALAENLQESIRTRRDARLAWYLLELVSE